MPLIKSKSKKAFEHNLKAEMHSGKPQDQALAIAYSVQRKSKRKKMADGGMAKKESDFPVLKNTKDIEENRYAGKRAIGAEPSPSPSPKGYAHGGEVEEHYESIADAILKKKHKAKMADGGMVDIEENGEEQPNMYDDLNAEAILKEIYDDNQVSDQPEDSNMHGHALEDDHDEDMISAVRKRMRSKKMG